MPSKPCKLWQGAKTRAGYGLKTVHGKNIYVHREAWAKVHGPIPAGMCILHHCDTPACYEEEHLFLGTKADNIRDMDAKGRRNLKPRPQKLSDVQVAEIRSRKGEPYQYLAALYGVTPQYIGQLQNGVWRKYA